MKFEISGVFRVCHVLASVGEKGGLEKNVIELANRQASLGHEVSAVADETMRCHFSREVRFIPHRMKAGRLNPFNGYSLCWIETDVVQIKRLFQSLCLCTKSISPSIIPRSLPENFCRLITQVVQYLGGIVMALLGSGKSITMYT